MDYKNCEVVLYFCGGINSYYQIKQWSKPLQELDKTHKVLFVITNKEVYEKAIEEYDFTMVFLETFTDVIEFYDENSFSIVLYINNSLRNFQSLRYKKAYHIHLNHGESEKESMHSNQSKGYDFVFTVGQRGIDRYKENLLNFDDRKYIAVGRPQLDFIEQMEIEKTPEQKVILYAPTWEATHSTMNYTSVKEYGLTLVKTLLENPNYIVIYKPHSAVGTRDYEIYGYNEAIKKVIEDKQNGYYMEEEDINNVFTLIDFAFFDNSSVMIDYLNTLKPAAYVEIRKDQTLDFLTKCFKIVDESNFENVFEMLESELENDSNLEIRKEIKEHYLGDFEKGGSTKCFISKIGEIIEKRNEEIKTKI